MLLDGAMMLMLNGALTPLPVRPTVNWNGGAAAVNGMPYNVNLQAVGAALLMSPLPVLTQLARQQIELTALQAAQAAATMADLSSIEMGGSEALAPSFDSDAGAGVGAATMVGAAAAALLQLRGGT
mgnify:CR=1 FL=1